MEKKSTKTNLHEKHRERLRQRYVEHGLAHFADHEVLELLLTYSIPRVDTNPTAHLLLDTFGSLQNVFASDVKALEQVPGIGPRSAILLHLLGDVFMRLGLQEQLGKSKKPLRLSNPFLSAHYGRQLLKSERYEAIYAVGLDKNKQLIHTKRLSEGTLKNVHLYIRNMVEYALFNKANSLLLLHNHPSGDPVPSVEDQITTDSARAALMPIGITLFDHIIIGSTSAYSFAQGMLFDIESGEFIRSVKPGEKMPVIRANFPGSAPLPDHRLPGGESRFGTQMAAENTSSLHDGRDNL